MTDGRNIPLDILSDGFREVISKPGFYISNRFTKSIQF